MCKKLVHDVGINDADYVVQVKETVGYVNGKQKQKLIWICPFYQAWRNMLERGYSATLKEKRPTYIGVIVCKDWWLFSNFKAWMEEQPFEGMQLDKDILVRGNKEYNANTCAFIPSRINLLLTDHGNARGQYPLGVHYIQKKKGVTNELKKPYVAQVATGVGHEHERKHLGYFSTPEEAHKAWQLAKADVIDSTVNWWQFESSVNHTFRQDVANALFERSNQLRYDYEHNIETQEI